VLLISSLILKESLWKLLQVRQISLKFQFISRKKLNLIGAVNILEIDKYSHQHQKTKYNYDLTVLIDGILREDLLMKYTGK
jgi:hypothetical protein